MSSECRDNSYETLDSNERITASDQPCDDNDLSDKKKKKKKGFFFRKKKHKVCYVTVTYYKVLEATSASARSISRHMTPVDAQNSAISGAIPTKIGENLSEMWPNRRAKFRADR